MINIFIIDDHPMVLEGIKSLLVNDANFAITGTANNAFAALQFLKQHSEVDVVLLDINLPDINGIELCAKLLKEFPALRILAMSTFKEQSYISRMMENGASGYVLKSVSADELKKAIEHIYTGNIYLTGDIAQLMVLGQREKNKLPVLTSREKEILACIAEGLTNNQMAEKLFISPLTVDSHRKNLLAKFNVKNTAMLIKVAVENNLI